jgi:beta-carotene 3-hydroxylase
VRARTVAAVSVVLSEPAAALSHRLVMHRRAGWRWHRSHHVRRRTRFEANDRFPLLFAGMTIAAMAFGQARGHRRLVAAGAGVTTYGLLYALVHDVGVHGRLTGGRPVLPGPWMRWVGRRHAVHHHTGAAPYGFLLPIAPPPRYRAAVTSLRGVETRARVANTS